MTYTTKPVFISALIGWRIGVYENNVLIHHYATRREAEQVRDSLAKESQPGDDFTPSVAFRERLRESHLERVREAQRLTS